jgi:hypothetical protein
MMDLEHIILHCISIEGMDRLILLGWAAQLEEDNATVYASKETVAIFLGMNISTIKRRTQNLLKDGWLVSTGERKQWSPDKWTPVYSINLEKLAKRGGKLTGGANRAPVQIDPQGYRSRSNSRSTSHSHSVDGGGGAGLRPVTASAPPPQERKTLDPKPKSKTNPNPKTCRRCGEELFRDKNHVCMDKQGFDAFGRATGEGEYMEYKPLDMPIYKPNDGLDDEPLWETALMVQCPECGVSIDKEQWELTHHWCAKCRKTF